MDYNATDKSLIDIIEDLESKYNLTFAYASENFQNIKLDVNFTNRALSKVLDDLTTENNLEYKIFDEVIMLRKANDYNELVSTQNYKTSYHLKGKVIDGKQNTPMSFASISLEGSTIGTYTDEEGRFDIEIPAKYAQSNITIQYLGYDDQLYKINETENTFLLVPLTISACNISEIMIVNREAPIAVGNADQAMVMNKNLLNNTTSGLTGNDLARAVQLMPGINASDDTSAEIKIRGSSSDETLLILDGIPVYNASHFYGIFSSINTDFLSSVTLYKNSFPIHYGSKTAGVVEMKSQEELTEVFKLSAEVNLLTASLNLSLPLTEQSSLFLSGRSTLSDISNTKFNSFTDRPDENVTTQNFMENLISKQADPDFKFYDINAKYAWIPNQDSKLSLNFYSSNDDFDNTFAVRGKRGSSRQIALTTNNQEQWNNLGGSAILHTSIADDLKLDARVFYSSYANTSFSNLNIIDNSAPTEDKKLSSFQENQLNDVGLNFSVTKNLGDHLFSLGFDGVRHHIDYKFIENDAIRLKGNEIVSEYTPYSELNLQLSDRLNIKGGMRATYYDGTQKLYLSPRLLLNYKPTDLFTFKGSYSQNQQFIREFNYEYRGQTYELWVDSNDKRIPIIESNNLMLGGTVRFGSSVIDIEAYAKDMTGMTEFAVVNPTLISQDPIKPRDYELFTGVGRAKGIDVLFSTSLKNYDTYLSYSISKVEHSFNEIFRGQYFASEDDRRHQLKWINEYHLDKLTLGANWIYSTGRLYTDLFAFENNQDIRNIDPKNRNKRLPAYKRLDLSAAYKLNFGAQNATIAISLFNTLDHQNVKYEQLIESRPRDNQTPLNTVIGSETNLLSRTLNLSFRFDLNKSK